MKPSTRDTHRSVTAARVGLGAATLAVAMSLTGCGSGADAGDGETSSAAPDAGGGVPEGGGAGRMPGAFGRIAAADGDVLQVQSEMSGQVAVTVGPGAEITDQVAADIADVVVGTCVVIQSADDSDSGTVRAESVLVSTAGDEGCAGGAGGPGGPGEMPTDVPSDLPSDFPDDPPSGMPTGRGGFGVVGEVVAVSDVGLTVLAASPGAATEEEVAVEVTSSTAFTVEETASASALRVGRCVSATGEADDTGAVTAERISVSDPVDGACAMGGFGGRMGAEGADR